jgi:hypothetical protein
MPLLMTPLPPAPVGRTAGRRQWRHQQGHAPRCPAAVLPSAAAAVRNPAEGHQMVLRSKLPALVYLNNSATCCQGLGE